MFEFRPGELFVIRSFEDKPENIPRNRLFLVKLRNSPLPEGLEFSKTTEDPATKPRPYGVLMMRELDDGWAWDWPDSCAREAIGNLLLKLCDEYSEEAILEKWLWLEISLEE